MLGDVLEAAAACGDRVRLVTDDAAAAALAASLGVEVSPIRAAARARRSRPRSPGSHGACLVVNADLPCVTPTGARAPGGHGSRARGRGGRDDERARVARRRLVHTRLRPGQRRALRRSRPRPVAIPELEHDVDTVSDLDAHAPSSRPPDEPCVESTQGPGGPRRVNVVLLSGGVGGAKLAAGLHDVLAPGELTIVGNVGDDLEVLGLHVSPDLDSVLYGLAGLNDTERGWGRAGETWQALESARAWGGEGWFMLGDLDIGLHLVRSQALRAGEPLSAVTARLAGRSRPRDAPAAGDRRPRCARTSSRRRERSPSRSGSSPAGTRTRSTRSSTRAPSRHAPRPACSRRSPPPTRS